MKFFVYADYICEFHQQVHPKLLAQQREMRDDELSVPVTSWVAEDRLHNGPGWEFVLILRTRGCEYGRNPKKGCTMCGYLNDAPRNSPTESQIWTQFEVGYLRFREIAQKRELPPNSVVFKIFTSGKLFDPMEVPASTQEKIFDKLVLDEQIGEVAVESRPEYIMARDPSGVQNFTTRKHLDVGVGLEAVTDQFRDTYIQKGFLFRIF